MGDPHIGVKLASLSSRPAGIYPQGPPGTIPPEAQIPVLARPAEDQESPAEASGNA